MRTAGTLLGLGTLTAVAFAAASSGGEKARASVPVKLPSPPPPMPTGLQTLHVRGAVSIADGDPCVLNIGRLVHDNRRYAIDLSVLYHGESDGNLGRRYSARVVWTVRAIGTTVEIQDVDELGPLADDTPLVWTRWMLDATLQRDIVLVGRLAVGAPASQWLPARSRYDVDATARELA